MAKQTAKRPPEPLATQPPPETAEPIASNRPAARFKYGVSGGLIEVAVWPKQIQSDGGKEFTVYNVQFYRTYKDNAGQWQTTDTVRGSDVPVLIHALEEAYTFVLTDRASHAQA